MIFAERGKVILRDLEPRDLDTLKYWEFEETEWQEWDMPIETGTLSPAELRKLSKIYLQYMAEVSTRKIPHDEIRSRAFFAIKEHPEDLIGMLSSYYINDDFEYDPNENFLSTGISIPDPRYRKKGYAFDAFSLYTDYLHEKLNLRQVYTQMRFDNEPMRRLALKVGYEPCRLRRNVYKINGRSEHQLNMIKYFRHEVQA